MRPLWDSSSISNQTIVSKWISFKIQIYSVSSIFFVKIVLFNLRRPQNPWWRVYWQLRLELNRRKLSTKLWRRYWFFNFPLKIPFRIVVFSFSLLHRMQFLSDDFTIMLFHYDGVLDEWRDLHWTDNIIHVSALNQTKW